MITFTLKYEDLIERTTPIELKVLDNPDEHIIQNCIDLFNAEIKWNEMFNLEIAKERLENGEKMFIGLINPNYLKRTIFGYCWLKSINENEFFIYNVFTKKNTKICGAKDLLYYVIKNYTNGQIYSEIDEWNKKSMNVAKKLGFQPQI